MDHLQGLKKVNNAYAWFNGVIGLICAIGMAVMTVVFWGEDAMLGLIMAGTTVFTVVLIGGIVVLLVMTGNRVEQGRWRLAQTILAVLNVTNNPPVGTAYGLYALWVCWSEPAAKAAFESPGGPPLANPPTSAGDRSYKIVMKLIIGFGVAFALLTVVTFVGMGWLMAWGGQATEVTVTDTQIEIVGMYGETIQRVDIAQIDLRDELPTVTARTNGYAMGDDWKGWFATRELGKVKLFVHVDSPPFLYMETPEYWVIYGSDDPDETRALYDDIAGPR